MKIEIPFELVENIPLCQVCLRDTTEQFFFDSGAPGIVLNAAYQPKVENTLNAKGIHDETIQIAETTIPHIALHGLVLENEPAHIADLSHLEQNLSTKIYGLIGWKVIKDYDVLYDYQNRKITLYPPTPDVIFPYTKTPLFLGNIPQAVVIPIEIAGKNYNFAFDSGAGSCAMDIKHLDEISQSGVFSKNPEATTLSGGISTSQVTSGAISYVTIAGQEFSVQHCSFSDLSHLSAAMGAPIDGVIGYDILSKVKVLVSYARQELAIEAR